MLIYIFFVNNRSRFLGLLKMMLPVFKGNNNQSHYAIGILHTIIQQLSLLDEQRAHLVFQACFVNTKGRVDTHIESDLMMEFLVKKNKKFIKHMYANKTESHITDKTSAVPGLGEISNIFDDTSDVVVHQSHHSHRDADSDEQLLMNDLRALCPFRHEGGRAHNHFRHIPESVIKLLDDCRFMKWFEEKKRSFIL